MCGIPTIGAHAPGASTRPRLWVLLMLHLAADKGLAMVDLKRSAKRHDYNAMRNNLLKFEGAGIVKARMEGIFVKYTLNPQYGYYSALSELLAAIAAKVLELKAKEIYASLGSLWPE